MAFLKEMYSIQIIYPHDYENNNNNSNNKTLGYRTDKPIVMNHYWCQSLSMANLDDNNGSSVSLSKSLT